MNTRTSYYHTCPWCGANLDPGEQCDCDSADLSSESTAKEAA